MAELITASKALPVISLVIKEPISMTVSPSFVVIAPAPLAAKLIMLTISLTTLIV